VTIEEIWNKRGVSPLLQYAVTAFPATIDATYASSPEKCPGADRVPRKDSEIITSASRSRKRGCPRKSAVAEVGQSINSGGPDSVIGASCVVAAAAGPLALSLSFPRSLRHSLPLGMINASVLRSTSAELPLPSVRNSRRGVHLIINRRIRIAIEKIKDRPINDILSYIQIIVHFAASLRMRIDSDRCDRSTSRCPV